jgi:hypothetical protein
MQVPDGRRLPVLKAQVKEVLPIQFYSFVQDTLKWIGGLGQLAFLQNEGKQVLLHTGAVRGGMLSWIHFSVILRITVFRLFASRFLSTVHQIPP